jgi:hypothetical protein
LFGEDGNSGIKVKVSNIHSKINAFNEFYDGEYYDNDEVGDIESFVVKRDAINKLWSELDNIDAINKLWSELDNIDTTIQDIESFAKKYKNDLFNQDRRN